MSSGGLNKDDKKEGLPKEKDTLKRALGELRLKVNGVKARCEAKMAELTKDGPGMYNWLDHARYMEKLREKTAPSQGSRWEDLWLALTPKLSRNLESLA